MRKTDFEKMARHLWRTAYGDKALANRPAIENLVQTCIGLAYGDKLLDQEPRK
jgi:hypothetical protein